MSRSGYIEDLDPFDLGRWRGRVMSAIRGKRGQALLRDLLAALDAMPEKRLTTNALVKPDGDVCALGAVCFSRGAATREEMLSWINEDEEDDDPIWTNETLAERLNVAECLIREIENENDEGGWNETPEQRWARMRAWVARHISEKS